MATEQAAAARAVPGSLAPGGSHPRRGPQGGGGYRTFFAGKWHLGGRGYWPENQGFDINVGGWTAGAPCQLFLTRP